MCTCILHVPLKLFSIVSAVHENLAAYLDALASWETLLYLQEGVQQLVLGLYIIRGDNM